MARKDMNFHNEAPKGSLAADATSEQVKTEFARRLQSLLTSRGLSQTDFAKAVEAKTGRALQAYHISNYIRGRSLPRQDVLYDLAKTLGVEPASLLPHRGMPEMQRALAPLEMRQTEDGNVWLKLNRSVTYATALKIMALLSEEDATLPQLKGDVRTRDADTGTVLVQKKAPTPEQMDSSITWDEEGVQRILDIQNRGPRAAQGRRKIDTDPCEGDPDFVPAPSAKKPTT